MATFEGKVALVMGASTPGGMGAATARRLRREGARVVVSGIGEQPLQELAQEIDGHQLALHVEAPELPAVARRRALHVGAHLMNRALEVGGDEGGTGPAQDDRIALIELEVGARPHAEVTERHVADVGL